MECKNLYYEPGFKVTFYKQSKQRDTLKIKDTLAVNILSFNGQNEVPKITNLGRASYVFPIPMNISPNSTVYNIEYHNLSKDSVEIDSFLLKYSLEQYFFNDRLLLRPINLELISYSENDTIDDVLSFSCIDCQNPSARITIYE